MILKYGSYAHGQNEVSIQIDRRGQVDEAGRVFKETERWLIAGVLQAESQAALTVAIGSLAAAYASGGQDLILYLDDGVTETGHALRSRETLGGTRVMGRPAFPEGRGAEYSTFRSYQITVEADSIDSGVGLLSYHESVEFEGGGDDWRYLVSLTGPPQRQTLAQQTTYRAFQQGQAVGLLAYPAIPAPLWPSQEHLPQRRIRRDAPDRRGPAGALSYENFRVSWSYVFESAVPLYGFPSLWRGR